MNSTGTSLQPYEDIMPESRTLKTAIIDILETPHLLSEVIEELHKYKIYVVNKQSGEQVRVIRFNRKEVNNAIYGY